MSKYRPVNENVESLSGINIIPVIDVSLVLLIILMATSPILNLPGFEVKLPKALTAESKEKNITISVGIKGQLGVNEVNCTPETLVSTVAKQLKDKREFLVIIRADQGVNYGQVQDVMDAAKKAGATRIAIATQQDVDRLNNNAPGK